MAYPIILAHGICRFDELLNVTFRYDDAPDDSFHYFKRIRTALERAGFTAYHSKVEWAAGVKVRARSLRQRVLEVLATAPSQKVNIIAHSMGGLDARHMLFDFSPEKLHEKVASVTTIGTPHHGTSFADFGVQRYGIALNIFHSLGLDLEGFEDLTRKSCEAFNTAAATFENGCGVRFRTYAGVQPFDRIFFPLKLCWALIHAHEGANDGLVPLTSAKWKDEYFAEQINADHLNEIGWSDPDDEFAGALPWELEGRMQQVYVKIAQQLP